MSARNKKAARARREARRLRRGRLQGDRRGVLLLVVLALLVLFSLLGAAFLSTSASHRSAIIAKERAHRTSLQPGDLMERALMQVLRDTNNPNSSIRYHSLLRDMYGTDGFSGRVYAPNTPISLTTPAQPGLVFDQALPQYAGVSVSPGPANLGPTEGQLIDLFIDSTTLQQNIEPNAVLPDDAGPFELELDNNGVRVVHQLSPTDGYYNGSLLTFTSGPARGQTTRIVDYDFVGDQAPFGTADSPAPMFRLRVVAFAREDGAALTPGGFRALELGDLVNVSSTGLFFGHSFIVSGRPFNGTGVGFNTLADIAAPRLTAGEPIVVNGITDFLEVALSPNSRYPIGLTVNDPVTGVQIPYDTFVGPGGPDESYDAPDYQNMFLAWQSLSPRARGRVIPNGGGDPQEVAQLYPDFTTPPDAPDRLDLEDTTIPSFHRPALVNYWMQRLFNAPWLDTAFPTGMEAQRVRAILQPYGPDLTPDVISGNSDDNATGAIAAQIVAIKRKIMLRPLPEDHPEFTGSNPIAADVMGTNLSTFTDAQLRSLALGGEITFPFWEATGPWDVDNDNDGVPDSIWVDLGMPVETTEDGRFYKPLFAILIEDMDGRLNLNAHGSTDQLVDTDLDGSQQLGSGPIGTNGANLPGFDYVSGTPGAELFSSNQLPRGSGWGVADISPRSVLSPGFLPTDANFGNPLADDYARLLVGRPAAAALPNSGMSLSGRFGSVDTVFATSTFRPLARPPLATGDLGNLNVPFEASELVTAGRANLDPLTPTEFFDYPAQVGSGFTAVFGSLPDLRGRYTTGVSFSGQPIVESVVDDPTLSLVAETGYEVNLSRGTRRGALNPQVEQLFIDQRDDNPNDAVFLIDDDAPFSVAELERLLRAFDPDAGRLPDRLWELVGAFDPDKLVGIPTPSSAQLVAAQLQSEQNRRAVTTRSFDVPATVERWQDRLRFGADGLPGVPGVDDNPGFDEDNDGMTDEADEVDNAADYLFVIERLEAGDFATLVDLFQDGCDDYVVVMGALPPEQPRLLDYLRYRVVLQLIRDGVLEADSDDAAVDGDDGNNTLDPDELIEATVNDLPVASQALRGRVEEQVSLIINGANDVSAADVRTNLASFGGLIAPEVIAGLKMNLNRPFGDGRDNNNNGVVDEPLEAGDPFVDLDGDGVLGPADVFLDLNGDGPSPNLDNLQFGVTVPFDHTRGTDANGRGAETATGERIIDDARMARQLYARHLYCLMLLLTDENYLAPIDPSDAQAAHYIDPNSTGSPANLIRAALTAAGFAGDANLEAERLARRKLTRRQIAQWAINCVDARDPDVIQTPFEYDENPWDGWNVVDTVNGQVYPLDGDLTTDENATQVRAVTGAGFGTPTPGNLMVVPADEQTRGVVWGAERPELLITETLAWHDRRLEDWGGAPTDFTASEIAAGDGNTIAFNAGTSSSTHDEELDQRLRPRGFAFVEVYNPNGTDAQRPAELYGNTAAAPGALGVQLDRLSPFTRLIAADLNGDGDTTDPGEAAAQRSSPVWRLISVEEHPQLRNDDPLDDPRRGDPNNPREWIDLQLDPSLAAFLGFRQSVANATTAQAPDPARSNAPLCRVFDPDFPTFDGDYTPQLVDSQVRPHAPASPLFSRQPAYVEREFYFVPSTVANVATPQRLYNPGAGASRVDGRRFLADYDSGDPMLAYDPITRTLPPILPGHYGVIGSAGAEYEQAPGNRGPFAGRYLSPVSRLFAADQGASGGSGPSVSTRVTPAMVDGTHLPEITRRIELTPNPNPFLHQVLVGNNFGSEWRMLTKNGGGTPQDSARFMTNRDANSNPAPINSADGAYNINVTDPSDEQSLDAASRTDRGLALYNTTTAPLFNTAAAAGVYNIKPVVAIPVAGLDLSSPVDDYLGREQQLRGTGGTFDADSGDRVTLNVRWEPTGAQGEGEYQGRRTGGSAPVPVCFDQPFDMQDELIHNHTTPNYRTVHLQRLANPLLPWNPPPLNARGQPNDGSPGRQMHDASRPVNPYLTVDSMPVDLTAINGTSSVESSLGPALQYQTANVVVGGVNESRTVAALRGQMAHEAVRALADQTPPPGIGVFPPPMTFSSRERGVVDPDEPPQPTRVLWAQPERLTVAKRNRDRLAYNDRGTPGAGSIASTPQVFLADEIEGTLVPDITSGGTSTPAHQIVDFAFRHSLGYANTRIDHQLTGGGATPFSVYTQQEQLLTADLNNDPGIGDPTHPLDINGDNVGGDLVGTPRVDLANVDATGQPITTDDATFPWLAWNNRPFISAGELLQVPAASAAVMLRDFSTFDSANATAMNPLQNPYDGDVLLNTAGDPPTPLIPALADAEQTNAARFARQQAPFGHLLNFFQSSTRVSATAPGTGGGLVSAGAPNFHRLLDYVYVPSRFVGTDLLANPAVFNAGNIADPADPRNGLAAPFNRLPEYREPGRVNLNTVVGSRVAGNPLSATSPVYDGIMHRFEDGNLNAVNDNGTPTNRADDFLDGIIRLGHRGPAWRDVVVSRRGYIDPGLVLDTSPMTLNPNVPTFFGNPFRGSDEGDFVPLTSLQRQGAESSMLRSHPWSPGSDGVWGMAGDDVTIDVTGDGVVDSGDLVDNDAGEAGFGTNDQLFFNQGAAITLPSGLVIEEGVALPVTADPSTVGLLPNSPRVPLFSAGDREPGIDGERNSALRYAPITRMSNLVTTRSGVYAVWITVGFFEVTPAPDFNLPGVQQRFNLNSDLVAARALYDRVYPDGYQLGAELGSETGDTRRFKSFFVIDRTLPVGFRPGDDLNVEDAVLLQRRIE